MENYINITKIIKEFNAKNKSKKILSEFWSNIGTKNLIVSIYNKTGQKAYYAKRGRSNGGTFCHPEIMPFFFNWLNKLPNQTFTRDEFEFCSAIIESFKGILKFSLQHPFGTYKVDMYCHELNIIIEYDEPHHTKNEVADKERENEIIRNFSVSFIRHSSSIPVYYTINKINRILYSNIS